MGQAATLPAVPLDGAAAMAAARASRVPADITTSSSSEARPPKTGPVAWRGLPGVAASFQQIGVWGEAILTQTPSIYPGLQRGCVAGTLYPGWQVSPAQTVPQWQRTQAHAGNPGRQRGGPHPRGQGPASPSAAASHVNVTAAAANAQAAQLVAQLRTWGTR